MSGDVLTVLKPAVLEERNGEIEFRVVTNDGSRESTIILTGLKCMFQKQLPKMPKDYIARLVYDRAHLSMAIVKMPLEVIGGITFPEFRDHKFAEIVFLRGLISSAGERIRSACHGPFEGLCQSYFPNDAFSDLRR